MYLSINSECRIADDKFRSANFRKNVSYEFYCISYWSMRVNSVDPDEAAHYELSHLRLGCLEMNNFLLLYIIQCRLI